MSSNPPDRVSTDPRQQIAALLAEWGVEFPEVDAGMILDALLPAPGALVLVRHEDGTTTSTPVKSGGWAYNSRDRLWREVSGEQ